MTLILRDGYKRNAKIKERNVLDKDKYKKLILLFCFSMKLWHQEIVAMVVSLSLYGN